MIKRLSKHFKYGKKGFTLIELLVVVAILGVLAAVAIPNVAKFIGSGKSEAAKTELANVRSAVTAYMSKYQFGWATTDGAESSAAITTTNLFDQGYLTKAVNGTYTIEKNGTVTQNTYP